MSKRNKIIYWIATIWLSVAMLASGLQQIFHTKSFVDIIVPLGLSYLFPNNTGCLENTRSNSYFDSKVRSGKRMGLCRFLFYHVGSGIFAYCIG